MRFQGLSSNSTKRPLRFNPEALGASFEWGSCIARAKRLLAEGRWIDGLALTVGYLLPLWFLR